jgi:hypothetical protein
MIICDIGLKEAKALVDIISSKIAPDAVPASQLLAMENGSLRRGDQAVSASAPATLPGAYMRLPQPQQQPMSMTLATGCASLDTALGGGLHAGHSCFFEPYCISVDHVLKLRAIYRCLMSYLPIYP